VRLSDGEREIQKITRNGAVRVWYRGEDPDEDPPHELEPGAVFEVQRPGDLFEAKPAPQAVPKPPPKTVAEGRERIFEHMRGLGWTVRLARYGERYDYVTDPSDTVRLKIKEQAVALQVRIFEDARYSSKSPRWIWNPNTRSLGQIKAFAANIERESAWLLVEARTRAADRFTVDERRIAEQASTPAAAAATESSEPVIVRYSQSEGVLLAGATKPNKDVIGDLKVPYRFKFSYHLPHGAGWYVPRTRGTVQLRERVEQVAAALRGRGVPVVVEYTDPSSTAKPTIAAKPTTAAVAAPEVVTPPPKLGRPPDNDKRAAKLRELADKMEAAAVAEIEAERNENTPRRASMAASIRDRAREKEVLAKAIRRSADVVERGELEYMGRVSSAAEIESLDLELRLAMYARNRKIGVTDDTREPVVEDVEFAKYTKPWARQNELRDLIESTRGHASIDAERRRVESLLRPRDRDGGVDLNTANLDAVRALLTSLRRDKSGKPPFSVENLADRLRVSDRLLRLGIHDTDTLREALREYVGCCRGKIEARREDPIAVKKRELRFAKIPGYFPTPRALAEHLVEAADIQRGHRVLEPSAGSGSIAGVIRERHGDAKLDVIEFNYSLHELLKAEGFNVIGNDFLAFEGRHVYDRVIMNPPFEAGQDVAHIQHALGVLEPGGRLVAIASAGLSFRSDAKTVALRERIEKLGGRIEPLPAGSFEESGTQVNTVMVVVDVPIAAVQAPPPPKPKPVEPIAAATPVVVDPIEADIQKRWAAHVASGANVGASEWRYLPKTSCWVRKDGGISATLCTAFQKHAIADCPPSMAGVKSRQKQFMLCQGGEEVEFFRGGPEGGNLAKAEGPNKIVRGRTKAVAGLELPRPAVDDFPALEHYLDSLVPSRIVYKPSDPLTPLDVKLTAPLVREGLVENQVSVEFAQLSLDDFENQLRDGTLIPYRGLVASSTLSAVLKHVHYDRSKLIEAGLTLRDVQYGRFGGRSVYWLRTPDGETTYGPYLADGEAVTSEGILREFHIATDEGLPLTTLPDGWTLEITVVVAMMSNGHRFWVAWQPSTELFTTKREGSEWGAVESFPRLAPWTEGKGFPDFVHTVSHTLRKQLESMPRKVRPRIAGPWLGALFPSDFPEGRVVFDPPTGGTLDLDELQRMFADYSNPDAPGGSSWVELGRKRIAWARRWINKQAAAEKQAARAGKDQDMSAKKKSGAAAKGKAKAGKAKTEKTKTAAQGKAAAKRKPAESGKPAANGNGKPANGNGKPADGKPLATANGNGKPTANGNGKPTANGNGKPTANGNGKPANGKPSTTSEKAAAKGSKPKRLSKPKTAKPKPVAKTKRAKPKATTATTEAKPHEAAEPSTIGAAKPKPSRALRFHRNDVVRFRKRSHVAQGLGVDNDRTFVVELMTRHEGRPVVVLRFGSGKHAAYMKVPPGHLALVRRADALPAELRACAAKLSRYDGPISVGARRLAAELARRS
jgi:phospholipid N-methyltransferase